MFKNLFFNLFLSKTSKKILEILINLFIAPNNPKIYSKIKNQLE